MELSKKNMNRHGTSLSTEPSMRLSAPPSSSPGKGRAFDDLGSSFAKPSSSQGGSSFTKPGSQGARSSSSQGGRSRGDGKKAGAPFGEVYIVGMSILEAEEDEIDFLSQPSCDSTPERKKVVGLKGKGKANGGEGEEREGKVKGGDIYDDWEQSAKTRSKTLQGMSFKKKKKEPEGSEVKDSAPSSSSINVRAPPPEVSRQPLVPPPATSTRPAPRPLHRGATKLTNNPAPEDSHQPLVPPSTTSTRPVPRPLHRGATKSIFTENPASPPKPITNTNQRPPAKIPLRNRSPNGREVSRSQTATDFDSVPKGPGPRPRPRPAFGKKQLTTQATEILEPESRSVGTTIRQPAAFPIELSPKSDSARNGKKAIAKDFPIDLSPLTRPINLSSEKSKGKHKAAPFPLSPCTTPKAKPLGRTATQPFPDLSPLSSWADKGKGKDGTSWEGEPDLNHSFDDLTISKDGIAAFPMSTQDLESIGRPGPSFARKRVSRSSSSEGSTPKRRREKNLSDSDEDFDIDKDSFFLDPATDPATLCPWCDEVLPDLPTPHLATLIAGARRKSYRDARPSNPLGLKAPLAAFVSVCQRHRFETHQIPLARAKGWPTHIDFDRVRERVEALKEHLNELVMDDRKLSLDDIEKMEARGEDLGPRGRSIFWKEILKEIKKKGSRAVVGVKGQFASFEKTQPGYYGELGSVIIHHTLYNLFPPSDFDPQSIAPFSPTEFIQQILVPEVAAALIMDDMGCDMKEAVKTLRSSVQYGVAMYPGDEDKDGMSAGEQIIKERAMARRRELEEEERLEEERLKAKGRPKPRRKGAGGLEGMSSEKSVQQGKKREAEEVSGTSDCEVQSVDRGRRMGKRRKTPENDGSQSEGFAIVSTDDEFAASTKRPTRQGTEVPQAKPSRTDLAKSSEILELEDTEDDNDVRSIRPHVTDSRKSKSVATRLSRIQSSGSITIDLTEDEKEPPIKVSRDKPGRLPDETVEDIMTPRPKPVRPLDAARTRAFAQLEAEQKAGKSRSMTISSDSESAGSEAPSRGRPRRHLVKSSTKVTESHSWLLSDPTDSCPSQSQ
ncbi:hypothetical protein JAAARDRAFT_199716 [Jaapia argillacea MUCL 33604]|uniref:Restriction of telomere capping protein 4 n=1 Tax=Jaapia argillacea MUCL 33604 TaxID=933084 RepID=A0A067PI67_9AGAM|nr:hypothetical protein JAAARDRAFT_199716 [Jaapia argillacea MUCL 33604]